MLPVMKKTLSTIRSTGQITDHNIVNSVQLFDINVDDLASGCGDVFTDIVRPDGQSLCPLSTNMASWIAFGRPRSMIASSAAPGSAACIEYVVTKHHGDLIQIESYVGAFDDRVVG